MRRGGRNDRHPGWSSRTRISRRDRKGGWRRGDQGDHQGMWVGSVRKALDRLGWFFPERSHDHRNGRVGLAHPENIKLGNLPRLGRARLDPLQRGWVRLFPVASWRSTLAGGIGFVFSRSIERGSKIGGTTWISRARPRPRSTARARRRPEGVGRRVGTGWPLPGREPGGPKGGAGPSGCTRR